MKFLRTLTFSCTLLFVTFAQAAFITLNEAGMDSVFGVAGLEIDIRYGTATELVFPSFLDLATAAEVNNLFSYHTGSATEVNFYFVDTISACGLSTGTGIVGCGETPGNDFVVESSFAAGSYGIELMAHELGHNLGLGHLAGKNLMNGYLNHRTLLTQGQKNAILLPSFGSSLPFGSPLVQMDQFGALFISINPVLVVATATIAKVSEPSTLIIVLGGMVLLLFTRRSKKLTSTTTTVLA